MLSYRYARPLIFSTLAVSALLQLSCASQQRAKPQSAQSQQSASTAAERAPAEGDPGAAEAGESGDTATATGTQSPVAEAGPVAGAQPPKSPSPASAAPTGGGQVAEVEGVAGASAAQTAGERADGLDRELDKSLREFDGLLLAEQRRLAEEAGAAPAGGATLGGGSSGGGETGASGATSGGRQSGSSAASVGSESMPAGADSPSRPGGEAGIGGDSDDRPPVPPDVGDGSDDDIIARQLREAAMSEEDPELREKLWDEYRAYKKSLRDGSGTEDE